MNSELIELPARQAKKRRVNNNEIIEWTEIKAKLNEMEANLLR